jgi:hypothetical protein
VADFENLRRMLVSRETAGRKRLFLENNPLYLITKHPKFRPIHVFLNLPYQKNRLKMKKRQVFLAAFAATMLIPTVAWAQYPQITEEAKKSYEAKQDKQREKEAWEKALQIVEKEAKEGRPYIPWASRPYDLPQADIPSFPGAEGGGMYTFGGRGGKVITVTNLNDKGPGSFREACETGGARIIVFNVAGIIRLETPITVRAPYVTIAGQTAPGDGVCIAGESFWVDTHDVIVRHMRFRRGETLVSHRDDSFGG